MTKVYSQLSFASRSR